MGTDGYITTGCSTTTEVWRCWSSDTTNCSTTVVWGQWMTDCTTSSSGTTNVVSYGYTPEPETEEQKAARIERERVAAEAREKQRREEAAAKERAAALLMSVLTAAQRDALKKQGKFELVVEGGGKPPRVYQIERSTHGNIKRLEDGKIVERWCVQPNGVPTDDAVAAQVLALRHAEDDIRKAANVTRVA